MLASFQQRIFYQIMKIFIRNYTIINDLSGKEVLYRKVILKDLTKLDVRRDCMGIYNVPTDGYNIFENYHVVVGEEIYKQDNSWHFKDY